LQIFQNNLFQRFANIFDNECFTLSFDVMIFQTITTKLKAGESAYEYHSKYVQICRSCNTPNQTIWSQMLSKNRQKFAKSTNQNICSQTLSKFARIPEFRDKLTNMANL